MQLRILHVLTTPRSEGTPNLVLDWLGIPNGPWQAVVVMEADPPHLTAHLRAAAEAYEEHNLLHPGGGMRKWAKFPKISSTIHAAVRRYRPDVVVCWPTGFANWVCAGAYAAGCRRLLVHAGNPPTRTVKGDWISRYSFWPLSAVRAEVVCCSHYVREQYQAIPFVPDLFSTVYNCVRADRIQSRAIRPPKPSGYGPVGLMVATLERHKDHRTLLRAVPEIVRRFPGFRLVLAGDGTLRTALESEARAAGCGQSVEFLGARGDVPELLRRSDLFIFSTTPQEGLGTVLLEALAAGLPVVASDVPACRELLQGGRYGRLVAPGDPAALAAGVGEMLTTQAGVEDRAGRVEYASGFTARRMLQGYLAAARVSELVRLRDDLSIR